MELVGFDVTSERLEDETFVVSVAGELDLYTVPELERVLLAADGARAVVVELSECTFIESTALGILFEAKRRLGGPRAAFSLAGAPAAVRRTFEVTGLDREFPFHQSLASALDGSPTSGGHERDARAQVLFREVNEQLANLADTYASDGEETFLCECGNPKCTVALALTRAEYERIREHASRFAIALNHENPEVETIAEQNERYAVVEVYAGEASRIARETDPRSQANMRAKRMQRTEGPAGTP